MGPAAPFIPYIVAAVGAGASYVNTRNQARKADNIALQSLQSNAARQKRADEANAQLAQDISASTPEAERSTRMANYMQQLQAASGDSLSGVRQMSGASSAYARDAADAALGIEGYGQDYAGLASIIDAAGDQRRREGRRITDAGTDLALLGREQAGDDRVSQMRLKSIRPNPWLSALSTAAQAYSMASAGMGAAGAGSSGWAPKIGAEYVGPTNAWGAVARGGSMA